MSSEPVTPSPEHRAEFRFWVVALSVIALLAVGLGVTAVVMAATNDEDSAEGVVVDGVAATTGGSPDDVGYGFALELPEGFEPRDPYAPVPTDATVHDITMRATETEIEVAPDVKQLMWTFDDMVPGPTLRGKVGDIFNITIVNEGEINHSIDFHSSKVAWDDEMSDIAPGESRLYSYEAKHAGIFMYHCGTAPALHHIGMGMYGAIVIDPPDLAPVDHEFVLVQSELYSAPEGEAAALEKMAADNWDAVVFNGHVNQYMNAPIQVEPGERIRVWVQNVGPSENSSFHIVGTVFDTVFKEGAYNLQPGNDGGSQALDLQPAQGGFVEFTFDENGLYPFVTHKFSNVGKGALGFFLAGEPHGEVGAH